MKISRFLLISSSLFLLFGCSDTAVYKTNSEKSETVVYNFESKDEFIAESYNHINARRSLLNEYSNFLYSLSFIYPNLDSSVVEDTNLLSSTLSQYQSDKSSFNLVDIDSLYLNSDEKESLENLKRLKSLELELLELLSKNTRFIDDNSSFEITGKTKDFEKVYESKLTELSRLAFSEQDTLVDSVILQFFPEFSSSEISDFKEYLSVYGSFYSSYTQLESLFYKYSSNPTLPITKSEQSKYDSLVYNFVKEREKFLNLETSNRFILDYQKSIELTDLKEDFSFNFLDYSDSELSELYDKFSDIIPVYMNSYINSLFSKRSLPVSDITLYYNFFESLYGKIN